MKQFVQEIDPVPSKRLFLSIIADYDLNRAVCELVDNAIDEWSRSSRSRPVTIRIQFDLQQQTISIEDNAGGVDRGDLEILVGPGRSTNVSTGETIGIFGVGTKRAVVALAENVQIRSRRGGTKTYLVEFDHDWLENEESWRLPVYEVSPIREGSTSLALSKLRLAIDESKLAQLRAHLQATYALFVSGGHVKILLQGESIVAELFEDWAYPPGFEPRAYRTNIVVDGKSVRLEAVAGLSRESSPGAGEYGVYFYCNRRLTARAAKDFEVGFAKGLAGAPHPNVSLVRVIVKLTGEAQLMPWNSSKSAINYNSATFVALRPWLTDVLSAYAKLSRNWEGDWRNEVFQHTSGAIVDVPADDFVTGQKTYLPPLPVFRPRYGDRLVAANQGLFRRRPFARGLCEGVIAADVLGKSRLTERNRMALIILDSTLEIAFKDYLVHLSGTYYTDAQIVQLFASRNKVTTEVRKTQPFTKEFWDRVAYFYGLRCKLVHERSSAPISDADLRNFREIVERALRRLFKLKFTVD